jgi:small subunit ribosomal protein S2
MTVKISLEDLLEAGAHFGHQTKRWNPKMGEYLYGNENGVHIFDLTKTKPLIEEALEFLKTSAKDGKTIVLLGTKKQVKEKVKEIAIKANTPYVNERWLGGTISNFDQIRKSLKKLEEMKENMTTGGYNEFTKKERLLIEREIARLERFFGGLTSVDKVPDILFVVDVKKEMSAVREASRRGVTIVGIVDSNSDPDLVDYVIPMNDDAAKAIEYILNKVGEAIADGKAKYKPAKKA